MCLSLLHRPHLFSVPCLLFFFITYCLPRVFFLRSVRPLCSIASFFHYLGSHLGGFCVSLQILQRPCSFLIVFCFCLSFLFPLSSFYPISFRLQPPGMSRASFVFFFSLSLPFLNLPYVYDFSILMLGYFFVGPDFSSIVVLVSL